MDFSQASKHWEPWKGLQTLLRLPPHSKLFVFSTFLHIVIVCLLLAFKYPSLPPLPSALIRGPIFSAEAGWGCLVAPLPGLTGPQIAHLCTWTLQTLAQALGNLELRPMGRTWVWGKGLGGPAWPLSPASTVAQPTNERRASHPHLYQSVVDRRRVNTSVIALSYLLDRLWVTQHFCERENIL